MELSDYFRILRNRWWVIPLLMVLTAAAAFGFSKIQTPVYESSLRLLVQPSRTDFGQTQAAKELLASHVQWLLSTYRAQKVINELQLDMTAPELLSDFNAASDNASYVIQITVENTDPDLANDIARTWGNLLLQWQTDRNNTLRLEDRILVEFLDDPQVGLDRPQTTINTAAGAVFGLLLGIIVVFALEWIESGVVRRTEDVERILDVPVIGVIPQGVIARN
jgi:capsular polysaccharide biosynthesis protein